MTVSYKRNLGLGNFQPATIATPQVGGLQWVSPNIGGAIENFFIARENAQENKLQQDQLAKGNALNQKKVEQENELIGIKKKEADLALAQLRQADENRKAALDKSSWDKLVGVVTLIDPKKSSPETVSKLVDSYNNERAGIGLPPIDVSNVQPFIGAKFKETANAGQNTLYGQIEKAQGVLSNPSATTEEKSAARIFLDIQTSKNIGTIPQRIEMVDKLTEKTEKDYEETQKTYNLVKSVRSQLASNPPETGLFANPTSWFGQALNSIGLGDSIAANKAVNLIWAKKSLEALGLQDAKLLIGANMTEADRENMQQRFGSITDPAQVINAILEMRESSLLQQLHQKRIALRLKSESIQSSDGKYDAETGIKAWDIVGPLTKKHNGKVITYGQFYNALSEKAADNPSINDPEKVAAAWRALK